MPNRSCSHASGLGAHQFHRPITCMNAGTSTIRTSVASASTASVRPSPNIRMNDTCAAISAANDIDITNAAAVITRPVRATPSATLSSLAACASLALTRAGRAAPEASQYSRIREIKNTS